MQECTLYQKIKECCSNEAKNPLTQLKVFTFLLVGGLRPKIRFTENLPTVLTDGRKHNFEQPFGCLMMIICFPNSTRYGSVEEVRSFGDLFSLSEGKEKDSDSPWYQFDTIGFDLKITNQVCWLLCLLQRHFGPTVDSL